MRKKDYLILLGIAAAAGTAFGILSDRRNPAKGSLIGATAGVVAGSIAAGVYEYVSSEEIPYYSSRNSYYDDIAAV